VLDGKNQFRFTFQAGSVRQFDPDHWMRDSGKYNVTVTYQPPSLVTPESERVDLFFNYSNATKNTNVTDGAAAGTNAIETGTTTTTISDTTTTSVSIVPASSTLTTDAFAPNPVQVSAGSTVTWTNDDAQPHSVTSGENVTPDGRFDSAIMAPAATFEHTFTVAGDYPYFCLLHPNQVGTVSVS
jgi:plastocyanin